MLKSWKVLGGLCCHLRLRHLVDIYQVIQILKSNGEGARGSEWYSCGTDVTGPPFGGNVELLIVVVETGKVCLMNNSETTEHSWHVAQRSCGHLTSVYIAVLFACSTGRHISVPKLTHWGRRHLNCLNCLKCLNPRSRGF